MLSKVRKRRIPEVFRQGRKGIVPLSPPGVKGFASAVLAVIADALGDGLLKGVVPWGLGRG